MKSSPCLPGSGTLKHAIKVLPARQYAIIRFFNVGFGRSNDEEINLLLNKMYYLIAFSFVLYILLLIFCRTKS